MKKGLWLTLLVVFTFTFGLTVQAKDDGTIKTGIFADEIELSGMSADQALAAIEAYVEELKAVAITLQVADNQVVQTTAGDLGITWENRDLVTKALELGTHGNVIQRYKILKDLEYENYVFDIEFSFDVQAINDILANECTKYNREAVNASLKRENGQFQVVEGQTGYMLDVETSIDNDPEPEHRPNAHPGRHLRPWPLRPHHPRQQAHENSNIGVAN